MDSLDPKFSFEIIDQPSDAAPGSMVPDKCDHEYNTRMSEDVTFSPAAINRKLEKVHEKDGWVIVSAEETGVKKIGSISCNQFPHIESEFCECQALRNQNLDSMTEVHDNLKKIRPFF